jgi:crossover junction endodeoxyribonuclease RuvC
MSGCPVPINLSIYETPDQRKIRVIIGIDPGLSGAVAALGTDGRLNVHDMPAIRIDRNGKARRDVDAAALVDLIRTMGADAVAWVERVGAMPGQGVSSMFQFGRAAGIVDGVLAALAVPISFVTPQTWRRDLHVPAGKDGSRLRASQLLPAYAGEWRRACDDGRAEAALIALYGLHHASRLSSEKSHG